jgi:phosphocarrier protein
MAAQKTRVSRTVRVGNELGLHARAAARIAELAKQAKAKIWLSKADDKVDASSIIDILTLAGEKGTRIRLNADDPSDVDILERIEALFKDNFGE